MESIRSGVVWLSFITLAAVSSLSFVSDETWDSFPPALAPARTFLADCRIAPAKYKSVKTPASDAVVVPSSRDLVESSFENETPRGSSARSQVRIGDREVKNTQSAPAAIPEEPHEPIGAPVKPTFAGHATADPLADEPNPQAPVAPNDDIFNDAQFDRDSVVRQDDPQSLAPPPASSLSEADAFLGESVDSRSIDERFAESDDPYAPAVNGISPMPEQVATDGMNATLATDVAAPDSSANPVQNPGPGGPIPPAALPPMTAPSSAAIPEPTVESAPQTPSGTPAVSNAVVDTFPEQVPAQPDPQPPVFADPLAAQSSQPPLAAQSAQPPLDAQVPATLQAQGAPLAPICETGTPQTVAPLAQTPNSLAYERVSCSALLAQGNAEGSLNAALESAKNIQTAEQGREVFVTLNQLRSVYIQNNRLDVVPRINEALDRLAFEVFYNPERAILEPLRYTRAGETLGSIALECNVTPGTLAAVNGLSLSSDSPLPPGTKLKVIRGPVTAEVSSSRKELLLKFNNLYAGRFPCGVPQQAAALRGEYIVENKIENPECQAVDMTGAKVVIEGGSPNNPLGSCWIGLNGGYGLQGTNRSELVGKDVPENGGFVFSNLHISQLDLLLPVGASIYFTD